MKIPHPVSGELIELNAEIPAEFQRMLELLKLK
jgi:hypothetical protein